VSKNDFVKDQPEEPKISLVVKSQSDIKAGELMNIMVGGITILPPSHSVQSLLKPSVSDTLIGLINVPIPGTSESQDSRVEYKIKDGWKVSVFYDVGVFDYLEHFINPDGEIVDFWEWPDSEDKQQLIDWYPPRENH